MFKRKRFKTTSSLLIKTNKDIYMDFEMSFRPYWFGGGETVFTFKDFSHAPHRLVVREKMFLGMTHINLTEAVEKLYGGNSIDSLSISVLAMEMFIDIFKSLPKSVKKQSVSNYLYNVRKWTNILDDLLKLNVNYEKSKSNEISVVSRSLPGVNQNVNCPCECGQNESVWTIVQHLNDSVRWSRGKIADWLDDLQDNQGYDSTF